MNIQHLLKKIEERRDKRKENQVNISSERIVINNMDIDQNQGHFASIGLVNEMPNTQNDRSYFKKYFEEAATEKKHQQRSLIDVLQSSIEQSNKLQKIQSELDDIEKMKSKFQQKKKVQNFGSIDKSCNNKSIDRHNLKPSQVPKIFKPTSQFSISLSQDFKENSNSYTFKEDSITNLLQRQQAITYKPHDLFESRKDLREEEPSRPKNEVWSNVQIKGKIEESHCECEMTVKDFMVEVKQKLAFLTNKVTQLQDSNSILKQKHERMVNKNIKTINQIKILQQQKRQLLETQQKWTNSKVQLESLLKDVKLKKQKQKSQKQNMSIEDCQTYFRHRDKSKQIIKDQNQLKSSSKNKVQNLLQRLQLRVEKS